MSKDYEDIVEELYAWAEIIEKVQGKASLVMLSGSVYIEAAEEIMKIREAAADVIYMIRKSENDFIDEDKWEQTIDRLASLTHEL